jgi:hypothetical protein
MQQLLTVEGGRVSGPAGVTEAQREVRCGIGGMGQTLPTDGNPIIATRASPALTTSKPSPFGLQRRRQSWVCVQREVLSGGATPTAATTHKHTHAHAQRLLLLPVLLLAPPHTRTHALAHTHARTHMYTHTHAQAQAHTHIHIHIRTRTHTHTL